MNLKKWAAIASLLIAGYFPDYSQAANAKKDAEIAQSKESGQFSGKINPALQQNKTRIYFFDVGQGDAIFIKNYYGMNILVDCGDNGKGHSVVDNIKSEGISKIDVLVTTHPHSDHIGGCDEVMENIEVSNVIDNGMHYNSKSYRDYIHYARQRAYFAVEDDCSLFNIKFFAAYKPAMQGAKPSYFKNANNNSLVLVLKNKSITLMIPGDCEKECEEAIISKAPKEDLDIEILKAGHHGSRTASTYNFLKAATPDIAVISAGLKNKYGHPHYETLMMLEMFGAAVIGTYEHGTIMIENQKQSP